MLKPIENWLSRHRNPTSFWLHMLGIPACFIVAPGVLLFVRPVPWALAGAMFVGGYALQFIGHLLEGNRSGEEMLLRRILARFGIGAKQHAHQERQKRDDPGGDSEQAG